MIKRFMIGIIVALILVGVYDYTKQKILLHQISTLPDIALHEATITLGQKGFYIAASKAVYTKGSINGEAHDIVIKIPFFKFQNFIFVGKNIRCGPFISDHMRVVLSTHDVTHIERFSFRDNRLMLFDKTFSNHNISGNADISKEIFKIAFYATMIQESRQNLFALTCYGSITTPLLEERQGSMTIKVTDFKNLLALLIKGQSIQSLQRTLIEKAFGDNIAIPLDIKGKKIYIGPLKIFEIEDSVF